jgi:hypothetical protein
VVGDHQFVIFGRIMTIASSATGVDTCIHFQNQMNSGLAVIFRRHPEADATVAFHLDHQDIHLAEDLACHLVVKDVLSSGAMMCHRDSSDLIISKLTGIFLHRVMQGIFRPQGEIGVFPPEE